MDASDKLNRTVEPRLGRVSAFTSGVENRCDHVLAGFQRILIYCIYGYNLQEFSDSLLSILLVFNEFLEDSDRNPLVTLGRGLD